MDKSSIFFLLVLIILKFQLLSAKRCQLTPCTNNYDSNVCNTGSGHLVLCTYITQNSEINFDYHYYSYYNCKTLLITKSNLTTVANNIFIKLKSVKLERLFLNNCQIEAIEPKGFNYLDNLLYLSITNNPITKLVTGTFDGLRNLQFLDLSHNLISTLEADIFLNLKSGLNYLDNLLYLNIAENFITKLVTGTFDGLSKLQFLNLSHNLISTLEADLLSDLKAVGTIIDLSYNKLSEMDNKIFHRNNKLKTLDIIKNSLTVLSKRTFDGLSKLDYLKLKNNAISVIEQDTFSDLKTIQEIDLSYNNLSKIPDYIFSNLDNLCNLNLSRNNIVSFNMTSSTNMSSKCYSAIIDLSYNKLLHLDKRSFKGKKIQSLTVNNNQITSKDINLDIASVQYCDFSYNVELNSLLVNNSRKLKLHRTVIKGIVEFGSLITDLDLTSTMIPLHLTTFNNAISLTRLLLDNNNLININEDVFESTVNLNYLSLRNNSINSLPIGLFRSLHKLQSLNLSNNNIFHFEVGIFSNLQDLKELNLGENKLSNIDVDVLYNLQRMEYINLTNNLLSFVNLEDLARHIHRLDAFKTILLVLDNNYWLCNWLVKAMTFTRNNNTFVIQKGNSFKVSNVNGIACRKNNTFLNITSQKPDQKISMLSKLTPPSTFPSTLTSVTKTTTRPTLELTSTTFRNTFLSSQKPEQKIRIWQTLIAQDSFPSTPQQTKNLLTTQFEESTERIHADNITKVKTCVNSQPIDNKSSTFINQPDPLQDRIFSFDEIKNHLDEMQDSLNEIKNNSNTDIRGLIIFAIILLCIIILSLFYYIARKILKSKPISENKTFQSCTMELISDCKNDDHEI